MTNNYIRVGGDEAKTGVVDLKNNFLNVANYNDRQRLGHVLHNYIEAETYGVFTNIGTLTVGSITSDYTPYTNNYVRTSGGAIDCSALTIHRLNGLSPVLTKEYGTGKVSVRNAATLNAPTYVWPSAEKGAPAGKWEILKAGSFATANGAGLHNIQLAPGTDEGVWKLLPDFANNSVWLKYSHPATIVIVR